LDTGLRTRFFVTIFLVLSITAASISYIHFHFFRLERLRLIELNLRQNATLLLSSDLSLSRKEFNDEGDELVEDIIGDDKVNVIVGIFNKKGQILYKNANAEVFDMPDSIGNFSEWEDLEMGDFLIKYLTVKNEKQNRVVRVGMVLNQSLIRWKFLSQRISIFAVIILFVVTLITFFLTYLLFRPLKRLTDEVNELGEHVGRGEIKLLGNWFQKMDEKKRPDEFQRLTLSLAKLAKKISDSQILTSRWSALMAHELKTPMTRLKISVESLLRDSAATEEEKSSVEMELKKLETIIMDFLDWASLENDNQKPILHAMSVAKKTTQIITNFTDSHPTIKFDLNLSNDLKIFCQPLHFEQVLVNLISNAIKYGKGSMVKITLEGVTLTIKDQGPGIPNVVLENFGKPFNKFIQGEEEGHGLGLAWINTIAKKYQWDLKWDNSSGTEVQIQFPESY
jgi:signal transduction histidine kinase